MEQRRIAANKQRLPAQQHTSYLELIMRHNYIAISQAVIGPEVTRKLNTSWPSRTGILFVPEQVTLLMRQTVWINLSYPILYYLTIMVWVRVFDTDGKNALPAMVAIVGSASAPQRTLVALMGSLITAVVLVVVVVVLFPLGPSSLLQSRDNNGKMMTRWGHNCSEHFLKVYKY